ncbi:MAG TPA: peptidase M50 [Ruminococcaceae bacterium]|nr:peptidase M50 [Oscillospiraceae bacterium]
MKLKLKKTELEISYILICAAAVCVISGIYKTVVYCVLAVVIHESGHLAAMKALGYFPKRIKISLFEINISDSNRQNRTARENLIIIFFGPAANFICFIACYLLYLVGKEIFLQAALTNLSVFCLNSLPVITLDGGQFLYILLCKKLEPAKAARIITVLTVIILIPLAAAGFLLLLRSKYNFSLLFVSVYLLMSLFMREDKYY